MDFCKKHAKKEPKNDFFIFSVLKYSIEQRIDAQIHKDDTSKSADDAPFLTFAKLIAKGKNADGGHSESLESIPSGHHKCGIETLHSKRVELLEHAKHHTYCESVCKNFPRKLEGVLLFFARPSIQGIIQNGEYCRRHVGECQKSDVRSCNLCGFGFAKQFDDARSHRGAHHCGECEKKPTFALLFFFLLDVEEHRKDQEKHAHNMGKIQGLTKGDCAIENH